METTSELLTPKEIATIFRLYTGQKVLEWNDPSVQSTSIMTLAAVGIETCHGEAESRDTINPHMKYSVSRFMLRLKPFSRIDDEEAIELAKVLLPGYAEYEIHDRLEGNNPMILIAVYDTDRQNEITLRIFLRGAPWFDASSYLVHTVHLAFGYLASRGFAVPVFFSADHPNNGKTALELGIAAAL